MLCAEKMVKQPNLLCLTPNVLFLQGTKQQQQECLVDTSVNGWQATVAQPSK